MNVSNSSTADGSSVSNLVEMLASHPKSDGGSEALATLVDAASDCELICQICADACANSEAAAQLGACMRLDVDCAEVCHTAAVVFARLPIAETEFAAALLQTLIVVTERCEEECNKHGEDHEHCRLCALACSRCARAARALRESWGPLGWSNPE